MCGVCACVNRQKLVSHGETVRVGSSACHVVDIRVRVRVRVRLTLTHGYMEQNIVGHSVCPMLFGNAFFIKRV